MITMKDLKVLGTIVNEFRIQYRKNIHVNIYISFQVIGYDSNATHLT